MKTLRDLKVGDKVYVQGKDFIEKVKSISPKQVTTQDAWGGELKFNLDTGKGIGNKWVATPYVETEIEFSHENSSQKKYCAIMEELKSVRVFIDGGELTIEVNGKSVHKEYVGGKNLSASLKTK